MFAILTWLITCDLLLQVLSPPPANGRSAFRRDFWCLHQCDKGMNGHTFLNSFFTVVIVILKDDFTLVTPSSIMSPGDTQPGLSQRSLHTSAKFALQLSDGGRTHQPRHDPRCTCHASSQCSSKPSYVRLDFTLADIMDACSQLFPILTY